MKATIITEKISDVLESALSSFCKNPVIEPVFVFPREVERNSWMEWVINESERRAVPSDFFIAWDDFKRTFILPADKEKSDGKTVIPPLMRKIFSRAFLDKALKEKRFRRLIDRTDAEFGADAFADWLAGILPSLKMWDNHYQFYLEQKNLTEETDDDGENLDMRMIFKSYVSFLDKGGFYEPSYADVSFDGSGKIFYIFYPQINDDFSEYYSVLSQSENVVFITLPPDLESEKLCVQYPDARKELRRLALSLRELQTSGVDLRRIAVSVPDLVNIRPYVERELRLYDIPFVVRDGLSYTKNSGGDIFSKILDCIKNDCSFDSVRNLLSDGFIPWKNPEMNLRLIQAGSKLRCICPVSAGRDVWEESFEGKEDYIEEYKYYKRLKKALIRFENATSFEALYEAWIYFRDGESDGEGFVDWEKFLDTEDPTYHLSNKVLGQMLTQLNEFSSIEQKYLINRRNLKDFDYKLQSYLAFFVNEMDDQKYNENAKSYGVNVYSYRVSSCADFDYQFIINANQNDITIPLKSLSFITDEKKREEFGLKAETEDGLCTEDASAVFVALYGKQHKSSGSKKVFWSSSVQNFNGAAITHTALDVIDVDDVNENDEKSFSIIKKLNVLDEKDYVRFSKDRYFSWQKSAFDSFMKLEPEMKNSGEYTSGIDLENRTPENINKKASKKIYEAADVFDYEDKDGKKHQFVKISASKMNSFYPCSKRWLYQQVLNIEDEKFSPHLAESNEIGTFCHKVLEILLNGFIKNHGRRVPDYGQLGYEACHHDVMEVVDAAFQDEEILKTEVMNSSLGRESLLSQKNILVKNMTAFVLKFCSCGDPDKKSGDGRFAGYYIEGTEVERTVFDYENDFVYHGFIDCILTEGGNKEKAVIVDFKSAANPPVRSACIPNPDDYCKMKNFQMAMYVQLLENKSKNDNQVYKVTDGLFYSLKGEFQTEYVIDSRNEGKKDRNAFNGLFIKNKDEGMQNHPDLNTPEVFKSYCRDFAARVRAFNLDVSGQPEDKNFVHRDADCANCQYKSLCRTSFNVAGKKLGSGGKN